MQVFVILTTIFAVSSLVRCDDEETITSASTEIITGFLSAVMDLNDSSEESDGNTTTIGKTFEKLCPGQANSIEEAIRRFLKCDDAEPLTDKTTCSYIKNGLGTCLEPIVKELEKCTPQTEKYAPKFIVDTIIATLSWVCDSTGETLLELINPCIDIGDLSEECTNEILEKVNNVQKNPEEVTKAQSCAYIRTVNSCVGNLTKRCNNQKTKDAVQGLANALASQCITA